MKARKSGSPADQKTDQRRTHPARQVNTGHYIWMKEKHLQKELGKANLLQFLIDIAGFQYPQFQT